MFDVVRSEWIKLSTLTVNKVLLIIAVAFPVIVTGARCRAQRRVLHLV